MATSVCRPGLIAVGLLLGAHSITGCTHRTAYSGGPRWIVHGSNAFNDGKKAFYGVGMSQDIGSDELRRLTAETNARADIGRTLDTFFGILGRQYLEGARAEGGVESSAQVTNALKAFTQVQLSGVRVIDRWISENGTEFALARLDFDEVRNSLGNHRGLNEQVREKLRQRADEAHKQLQEEEDRRRSASQ